MLISTVGLVCVTMTCVQAGILSCPCHMLPQVPSALSVHVLHVPNKVYSHSSHRHPSAHHLEDYKFLLCFSCKNL